MTGRAILNAGKYMGQEPSTAVDYCSTPDVIPADSRCSASRQVLHQPVVPNSRPTEARQELGLDSVLSWPFLSLQQHAFCADSMHTARSDHVALGMHL